jgi:hypothetical protein
MEAPTSPDLACFLNVVLVADAVSRDICFVGFYGPMQIVLITWLPNTFCVHG